MSAPPVFPCPGCSSPVPAGVSEGLCASCLLLGVLERGALDAAPPESEDPAQLRRCGDYEITGIIARGGMGVVFRAHQAGLSRTVALKMIAAADLAGPDEVRRFRLEAELIARLEHPHIVPIHAVGEHDGRPFFVMKLAESTLEHQMKKDGVPAPEAAAALMVKVARAVQFAHGHGVLHRDLKPANILLDAAGEPLVTDFGLARLAHGPGGSTLMGSTLGTPAYMAPEQARGAEAVTIVSDVYGLGAILYHLLTGRPPFTGGSALQILRRAETEEPVNPRTLHARVDRDLATICLKCLEKNPARRYASAGDLADDLERRLRGEPVVARPAPLLERAWKWARRHPAVATLLAAGAAGAAILLTVLISGSEALRRERNYARDQESIAKAGTARAEAGEQQMRLHVYASDLFLARRAASDGNMGAARRIIERHIPAAGQADLRGFEWYTLQRQFRGNELLTFTGHTGPVPAVAFHPGGKLMATGGRDGVVRILNVADGSEVAHMPCVPAGSKMEEITMLAGLPLRSPETTAALAGSTTFEEMRMRARPSAMGELLSMAWSPDGQMLLTCGDGSYPRLWKMPGLELQGFIPEKAAVQCAFTPGGRHIVIAVVGSSGNRVEGEVRLYEAATLRRTATLAGRCACFGLAREAPALAVADKEGNIEIVNTETGAALYRWASYDNALSLLALSPDARWLVTVNRYGAKIHDVQNGSVTATVNAGTQVFRAAVFTPDSRLLALGGTTQQIQWLDVPSGTRRFQLRGHDDEVLALACSPDGSRLLSGSNDLSARLWDTAPPPAPGADANLIYYSETGALCSVSESGQYLLGSGQNGTARCFDTIHKRVTQTPSGASRRALALEGRDGRFATIREDSATLEWWLPDSTPAGPPVTFETGGSAIHAVCPAAGLIAFAGDERQIYLCDWHTGRTQAVVPDCPLTISRLMLSPRGRFVAAYAWPRQLCLYDRQSGQWLPRVRLSAGTVGPVVFSGDEKLLASAGDDNVITVRDALTGGEIATLRAHMAEVKALAFSPDNLTLASSSADQTIRLWHVPTWRELGALPCTALCPQLFFSSTGLVAEEYMTRWMEFPVR